jgi:hypothetical protein
MVKNASSKQSSLPNRSTRDTLLLRRLQSTLLGHGGKAPTYMEMEEWTGVAKGTIKDWFNNQGRPTVEFLISLMERIPREECRRIIQSVFRCLPSLADPRLKCDQTVISQLKTIASQNCGVTFIYGGTAEARTFLVSALGNASLACNERPFWVAGFDIHKPDWFVPVPGVRYLCNLFQADSLRKAIRQEWPEFRLGKAHLIILNGVCSAVPEMQKEIMALAVRVPVMVADATIPRQSRRQRNHAVPVNYACVSPDSNSRTDFFVAINAA